MPFTAAHPALVLPIKSKWPKYFSLTALVIGSMSPDFEFFIHFYPLRGPGHTMLGSLYFNLPLVFLTAVLFHHVVKKPLIYCLPEIIGKRFYKMAEDKWSVFTIRNFLTFAYSALIGMATHFFLDAFTHPWYLFKKLVPQLTRVVFSIRISSIAYNLPVYNIIHLVVTLAGFAVILYFLLRLPPPKIIKTISSARKWSYWLSGLALALAVTIIRTYYVWGRKDLGFFEHYGVSFLSGLIIGFLAVSFVYKLLFREFR
jgi:hypothetical protein